MVSNVRASIGLGLLIGLILSALLMLMASSPSQAQTDICKDQFTKLRTDTNTVAITGKDDFKIKKERDGLLNLVDDAQGLASIGKTSDAVKKLNDFTVKVDQLEVAGRISTDSANLLRDDAEATITCLLDH